MTPLSRAAAAPPVPRPGESLPGGSPPLAAAPAFGDPRPSRLPPDVLRASLRASHAEGMTADLFNACVGGAVMTAWALHLTGLHVLFLLSALGRALAAGLAWRITERDARTAGAVLRAFPGELARRLRGGPGRRDVLRHGSRRK